MSKIFPIIAGVVLLVGTLIFAFSTGGDSAPVKGPRGGGHGHGGRGGLPDVAPSVSIEKANAGDLDPVRFVPGTVRARAAFSLRAKESGTLQRVPELGARVERRKILATIDAGTLPAEIRRAEALHLGTQARKVRADVVKAAAERALKRQESLAAQKATTAAAVDEARADLAAKSADVQLAVAEVSRALADIDVLKARLEERFVRAPETGKVATVHVELGEFVNRGEPVLELIGDGPLEVRFTVSESEAGALELGQRVQLVARGRKIPAIIKRMGAALEAQSRALPVEAEVVGDIQGLIPGMYVDVEIAAPVDESSATVPVSALVGRGGERKVFRLQRKEGATSVAEVAVRVLADDGKRAAVSGVQRGDEIVVAGARELKDAMKVEVIGGT